MGFKIFKLEPIVDYFPGITEKTFPPGHQSPDIGPTLDVVYRKLKVVEAPFTSAIGS